MLPVAAAAPSTRVCPSACSCSARPPRMVEGSGSDGPLQCQRLVLAGSPSTEVVLDPSTYGYQGCSCKAPFSAESTVQGGVTTSLHCVVPNQVRESRTRALQESDCRLVTGQLQEQVVASAAATGRVGHAAAGCLHKRCHSLVCGVVDLTGVCCLLGVCAGLKPPTQPCAGPPAGSAAGVSDRAGVCGGRVALWRAEGHR